MKPLVVIDITYILCHYRTDLCNDERLRGVVLSELQAKLKGIFENLETPRNIRLVADQVCSFKTSKTGLQRPAARYFGTR